MNEECFSCKKRFPMYKLRRSLDINVDTLMCEPCWIKHVTRPRISLNLACKILCVSNSRIDKAIEDNIISPEWNASHTKMRLRQEDIDKLKAYLKPVGVKNGSA